MSEEATTLQGNPTVGAMTAPPVGGMGDLSTTDKVIIRGPSSVETKPKQTKFSLPHLASRIFGVPLAVSAARLQTLLTVLTPRFLGQELGEAEAPPPHDSVESDGAIAIIPIVGTLVKRGTPGASFSDLSYDEIQASFMKALNDPAISAIVFDIDSPGGEVSGMLDLSDAIFKARGTKPIIAVANELAASAAYAIASAADTIVVPRTGMVGSVGVLAVHVDVSAMDKMDGLKFTTIKAGARKDDGNPHEPLSEEAHTIIQAEVDRIYGLFTELVARNRGMEVAAVRKTEAGVFSGEEAIAVGFADEVGTLASAIAGALSDRADRLRAEAQQAEIRAAVQVATSRNIEIAKLCQLAGLPQVTAEFQERGLTAEQAKEELLHLRRRAQRDMDVEIQSQVLLGTTRASAILESPEAIFKRRQGKVLGR